MSLIIFVEMELWSNKSTLWTKLW